MTRFQKIQLASSIVPFFSTVFVLISTSFELKRHKARVMAWVLYGVLFFLFGIAGVVITQILPEGTPQFLGWLLHGCVSVPINVLLVLLQKWSAQYEPSVLTRRFGVIAGICLSVGSVVWLISNFVPLVYTIVPKLPELCAEAETQRNLQDMNGESDTSLAVYTKDEIISGSCGYSMYMSSEGGSGDQTLVEDHKWRDYDYDRYRVKSKKASGGIPMMATQIDADELTLCFDSTLESGNAVLYILVDEELYSEVKVNCVESVRLEGIRGKLVRVILGVEAAKIEVIVTREYEKAEAKP